MEARLRHYRSAAEFYDSPQWAAIRRAALDAAQHRCQLWAGHTGRVEVHHRTYERFGGAERLEDLCVLCEDCHGRFHDRLPKLSAEQAALPFSTWEIIATDRPAVTAARKDPAA